jgi:hypothetical protein
VQVIVGKRAAEGIVELKLRHTGEKLELPVAGLAGRLGRAIAAARAGANLGSADLN